MRTDVDMDRPIIILGAGRSGTTLLGRLLSQHPDVAYWIEPLHIWRHRNAYRRGDILGPEDATPAVRRYVRREFEKFTREHGRTRFAEKTPSNCLRVSFIREIFPQARFIHLVRDGRAVSVSARVQWTNGEVISTHDERKANESNSSFAEPTGRNPIGRFRDAFFAARKFTKDTRKFTGGVWAYLEAPAYVPGGLKTFGRKLLPHHRFLWGPRVPGLAEVARTASVLDACAYQWAGCVQAVRLETRDMGTDQLLELRYEELLRNPHGVLQRVCDFADLRNTKEIEVARAAVRTGSDDSWMRRVNHEERAKLDFMLRPLLRELGYVDDREYAGVEGI